MSTTPSFIYLIEAANGLVKIGRGQRVRDRLQATRVHSPILTRLIACWPGSLADEDALHERFRDQREHGEWFAKRDAFAEFVERCRGVGVDHIPHWNDLKFYSRPAYLARRSTERRAPSPKWQGKVGGSVALGVTPRQARALAFIRDYAGEHSCSPSYQEIADELGLLSKSGVHRLVHGLVERGHLVLAPGQFRSIVLAEAGPDAAAHRASA